MQSLDPRGPPRKKFKALQSEIRAESEYNLGPSAMRVELADLMPSLDDSQEYGDLKRKLEKLSDSKEPVAQPLSERLKDRITRQAAYQKASKDVSRWQDTVKKNRVADQLRFPMNVPVAEMRTSKSIANEITPKTELEAAIASVLEESGVQENKIKQFEELATNLLTAKEVEDRRAELSKMRSLMLYQERKGKHQNKIKGKRFRKMLRREQEKEKLSLEELAVVDPAKYHKLLEERELERIKERLTLKHNNTSKWAKRAVKQKDLSSRQAIQDQINQGAALRRKMENLHGSDSDSDAGGDSDGDLEAEYDRLITESEPDKGLHAMAFMKRAAQKHKEAFLDSLDPQESVGDDSPAGRRRFTPSAAELQLQKVQEERSSTVATPKSRKKKSPLAQAHSTGKQAKVSAGTDSPLPVAPGSGTKNPWMNLKGASKVTKEDSNTPSASGMGQKAKNPLRTELDVEDIISVSEQRLAGKRIPS